MICKLLVEIITLELKIYHNDDTMLYYITNEEKRHVSTNFEIQVATLFNIKYII